jgi:nitrogen fixation protein FixH
MTNRPTTNERQFTGRHMLILLLVFFGVVIAANVTMAVIATGSWTGLVVPNSYVASQQYNKVLADARAQDGLGWQSTLAYHDATLRLTVKSRHDRIIEGLDVTAKLSVPAHEHRDHQVAFTAGPDGRYVAMSELEPGDWRADVTATDAAGRKYRQIFRFFVKNGS